MKLKVLVVNTHCVGLLKAKKMIKTQGLRYSIPLRKVVLAAMFVIASTGIAQAAVVTYTLNNIFSTSGGLEYTGVFQWDYTGVEFENGTGTFSELFIPGHDPVNGPLNITFDIGSSIEFTLAANLHNQGVDVTLFFLDPLTPTSGSLIDTSRSKWAYGGGFNGSDTSGTFASGSIDLVPLTAVPVPAATWLFGSGLLGLIGMARRRKA